MGLPLLAQWMLKHWYLFMGVGMFFAYWGKRSMNSFHELVWRVGHLIGQPSGTIL